MAQTDPTIHVHTPDGKIVTLGAGDAAGVWPENLNAQADGWGPSGATFDLKRRPGTLWPDLAGGSRVDVEIAGLRVWSGYIDNTPTRDAGDATGVTVVCKGPQYHLDDDVYERAYVQTKLSAWRDQRAFLTADLTQYRAAGQVSADGAITLSWPDGSTIANGERLAVTLDLGPYSTAKRLVVDWESSAPGGSYSLYGRGHDIESEYAAAVTGAAEDAFVTALSTASGTSRGTFTTARRYVTILLYVSGAGGAVGPQIFLKLKAIRVFADTAYESSDVSTITAPTIVRDARDRATVRLSTDDSAIDTTTSSFAVPEFALDGPRTPREVIDAADAYEDRLKQVDADWRLIYKPRPTAPEIEIGDWAGSEFTDASANSIDKIRNRVLVTGQDAAGQRIIVDRAPAPELDQTDFAQPANSSADTNSSNWTKVSGTGTGFGRGTSSPHTAPGVFVITTDGGLTTEVVSADVTQALEPGRRYGVRLQVSTDGLRRDSFTVHVEDTAGAVLAAIRGEDLNGSYFPVSLAWSQRQAAAGYRIRITHSVQPGAAIAVFLFDSIEVGRVVTTLVDRQGYVQTERLPINSTLTQAVGERIGDLYLAAHRTTPFKGDGTISPGGARRVLGGGDVHPAELLLHAGRLIRHANRVDPDTGAHGRDGTVAAVTYAWPDNVAQVTFDDERHRIEKFLERLAVVTGS